jgi:hypothetical protein
MDMKTKSLLLLILVLNFSCHNKSGSAEKDFKSNATTVNGSINYQSIIGSWQICKMIYDGTEEAYNTCPTIIFSSDGNGSLNSSEKTICVFTWAVKTNFITFTFKTEEEKNLFIAKDTEFKIILYDKDDLQIFELIQPKNSYKYILSRVR